METDEKRASEHFPPDVRERLIDAAAHPEPYWRAQRIDAAHQNALALYPEMFKKGA
jgi:hypothetical protein